MSPPINKVEVAVSTAMAAAAVILMVLFTRTAISTNRIKSNVRRQGYHHSPRHLQRSPPTLVATATPGSILWSYHRIPLPDFQQRRTLLATISWSAAVLP